MALLVMAGLVNIGLAVFGGITVPKDFASYLVTIFITNLLLYTTFYIIMKVRRARAERGGGRGVNWWTVVTGWEVLFSAVSELDCSLLIDGFGLVWCLRAHQQQGYIVRLG